MRSLIAVAVVVACASPTVAPKRAVPPTKLTAPQLADLEAFLDTL